MGWKTERDPKRVPALWGFLPIAAFVALSLAGCPNLFDGPDEDDDPIEDADDARELTAFGFSEAQNDALSEDIEGRIDQYRNMILAPAFSTAFDGAPDRTGLVAEFETTGASVVVDGVEQVSGETENDFTEEITYTVIAEDGSTREYVVAGVEPESWSADDDIDKTEGEDYEVFHFGSSERAAAELTLEDLDDADVFVTFTNPNPGTALAPVLETATVAGSTSTSFLSQQSTRSTEVDAASAGGGGYSATPLLREEFDPVGSGSNGGDLQASLTDDALRSSEDNGDFPDRELFLLESLSPQSFTKAGARNALQIEPGETPGTHGLVIWVEDEDDPDSWFAETGNDIDEDQVAALARAFIGTDGPDGGDDMEDPIVDVVSDVFGKPWGQVREDLEGSLLDAEEDYLHIFLGDIARAGDPSESEQFVIGYFFGNDVFIHDDDSNENSNEKLMLYLHAPAFDADDNEHDDWDLTDFWPSEVALTAAHELQHLVHFYQKVIRADGPREQSDTWLDELTSMMAEEIVGLPLKEEFGGDDSAFAGPRGINPEDLSAGESGIDIGRLPWFNAYNTRNLVTWGGPDGVLPDYGTSYAFGAWLARNYGGAPLMGEILGNDYGDHRAVEAAVAEMAEEDLSFGELLERWSAAVLLSDRVVEEPGYRYRKAEDNDPDPEGFTTEVDGSGRTVTLGSIDLFNYEPAPKLYTVDDPFEGSQQGYSNVYYEGPQAVSGVAEFEMSFDSDTRVTVIVRER